MFYIETIYKIRFDSDKDTKNLEITLDTLERLIEVFSKGTSYCSTEIETLKAATHIINEIQREEAF